MYKYFLVLAFFCGIQINSQIKIREDVKLKSVNNSPVKVYDSLFDFHQEKNNIDYLRYVGQKLILPPKSSNYNSRNNTQYDIGFFLSDLDYNKEYEIIDIQSQSKPLREIQDERPIDKIEIKIKDSVGKEILIRKNFILADKSLHPFFLKGFYEFHSKNYLNKTLFVFKESEKDYELGTPKTKYIDVNTGENIMLNIGDFWECKDIVFIDPKFGTVYYPYYILQKDKQEIKVELGTLLESGLITLDELDYFYKIWSKEKQLKVEEIRLNKLNYLNDCTKYFSKNDCNNLIENKIDIGMNKKMIYYAFGEPFKIFKIKSGNVIKEIFSYGSTLLYFKNDVIYAIEKR